MQSMDVATNIPIALNDEGVPPKWVRRIPQLLRLGVATVLAGVAATARAGQVAEIIRIHDEAIGGAARIAALKAIRASGHVVAGGRKMQFSMLAVRPNQVRVETDEGARSLIQAYDGKNPPWQFDTGTWPPRYSKIPPSDAKVFAADAEFDDPLVGGAARGYTFDYAGTVKSDGKELIRLFVTQDLTDGFSLLLNPDTYLIVERVEDRKDVFGHTIHVLTLYGDYRPVDGVLLPHRVTVVVNGRATQQTVIDSIQGNPDIPADSFTRPASKS
ncbi:MAG TPA: hypothetical protein VHE61_06505 [Opitutaceae bacterium]|nr:hypothetical protein [Opitutaceae bacterium]